MINIMFALESNYESAKLLQIEENTIKYRQNWVYQNDEQKITIAKFSTKKDGVYKLIYINNILSL